jgi:glycosyltransferase involved in cell wall biosynthesis
MKKTFRNKIHVLNIDEEGRFGGPERRIVNVAHELKKIGVYTTILMPTIQSENFENYALNKNVSYIKIDITRLTLENFFLLRYVLRFFKELIMIRNHIKKVSPDIVHINGAYQFKSLIAALFSKKRIVWHLNNESAHPTVKFVFSFLKFFNCSFIVSSDRTKEFFIPKINNKRLVSKIIPPVLTSEILPKKNYRLVSKNITIGTLTNISPQKDILTFVKSAHEISKKYPNAKFLIAGPLHKSQRSYYKKILTEINKLNMNDKIKFVGFTKNINNFLKSIDIFVCTSAWEAGPIAVWEALAAGLPVVSTNVGSTAIFLEKKKCGYVANVQDYRSISLFVVKLIENLKLREKFGKNARKVACDHLSVNISALLHKKHYLKQLKI